MNLRVDGGNEVASVWEQTGRTDVVVHTVPLQAFEAAAERAATPQIAAPPVASPIGKEAPEIMATGWVNSSGITIQSLRGKIVLFDTIQCCTDDLFAIQELAQTFSDRGVMAIGLSQARTVPPAQIPGFPTGLKNAKIVFSSWTAEKLKDHVRQEAVTIPIAIDDDSGLVGHPGATAMGLGLREGEYALVDRNGRIAYAGSDFHRVVETLGALLVAPGR